MPAPGTDLLIVGDIHLGRLPGRVQDAGFDARELGPAVAWRRAVDAAIDAGVDAVLLAGDVVDDDADRFEAYGHLEAGVARLSDRGIAVLGVAGNHDGLVLPRLAERIPSFRLLGRDSRWERAEIAGAVPVDLLGWSFSGRHHRDNPLESPGLREALAARRPDATCLGLLHCDLDGSSSPYAPVPRHQLEALGLDGWFLGHVHNPDPLPNQRPLGYLGSLVGLDRGEPGAHGPCRVRVFGPGHLEVTRLVLGPVVWLEVEVPVGDLPDDDGAADALHLRIETAFRQRAAAAPEVCGPEVSVVACSVRLTGPVAARGRVRRFVLDTGPEELRFRVGEQPWVAIALRDHTRPAVALHALASQPTPIGVLARLLLDLEAGGGATQELRAMASGELERFGGGRWHVHDERHPPPQADQALLAATRRLLDTLLAQNSGHAETAAQGGA